VAYFKYFVLLNAKKYFLPQLEKLEVYNLDVNAVSPVIQNWFDYKTPGVWCASKQLQAKILVGFPPLFLALNVLSLLSLIAVILKKAAAASGFNKYLVLSSVFLIVNILFSVTATINVFRYQLFPMMIYLSVSLIAIEVLEKKRIDLRAAKPFSAQQPKELDILNITKNL